MLGGGPIIHCPTEQQGFGGIFLRSRRGVCVCNPEGSSIGDPASVATDITNITVSWEQCMYAGIAPGRDLAAASEWLTCRGAARGHGIPAAGEAWVHLPGGYGLGH